MKRWLTLVLVLSLFFLLSCGGDGIQTPDAPSNPVIAQESIGAAGGTLEAEGFSLTVPAGAFDGDQDLQLRLSGEDEIPEVEGRSELYQISGLPAVLNEPLEIRFEMDYSGEGEPFLALGGESFAKPGGEGTYTWEILDATTERGTVVATIPPYDSQQRADLDTDAGCFHSWQHLSSGGHFKILCHPTYAANVSALAGYFEEAYTQFADLGWSYADRSAWPVTVRVIPLGADADGETYGSIFGHNYGSMAINTRIMGDLPLLRITAGHEFFHLVQAFYDPRWAWPRAKSASPHYWLDEAASTWAEALFTDHPSSYLPSTLRVNVMEPFQGLHAGGNQEASHGYGCAGVVKYLVELDGESALLEAYQAIEAGEHAVRALEMGSANEFTGIWNNLMMDYFEGGLYGSESTELMANNHHGEWVVADEGDTLHSFSHEYPALSAKLYRIKLSYDEMEEGSSARFTRNGPDPGYLSVYRYHSLSGAELLGLDASSVLVPDLKDLADANAILYVLVTNCRDEAPGYWSTSTVETELRIVPGNPILDALARGDRLFYRMGISPYGEHSFQYSDPDTTYTFTDHNFPNMGGNLIPGDIFGGPWPALGMSGASFQTPTLSYGDWTWQISGSFSADGQTLSYVEGVGEYLVQYFDGDVLLGEDRCELIMNFAGLPSSVADIQDDSCYLAWGAANLGNIVNLSYQRTYPVFVGEPGTVTITYLGTAWGPSASCGFNFQQLAP